MDEPALRNLIARMLERATADGARSLGMPAIGTGTAAFHLGRASEISIEELLVRLIDTPIERVVIALMGDEAERLFYERLVRTQGARLASLELRRHEAGHDEVTAPSRPIERPISPREDLESLESSPAATHAATANQVGAAEGEIIEQFPRLIDQARLSATSRDRPRLVDGLSDLILKHADAADIESELLNSPACRGFRGTLKQRLMEFLYLSEDNLRTALGPALFSYEGTYENRNGERFVYFLDEAGRQRKVRTDDPIDSRRHYYCFATNNPVHLYPTLIPKLQ
jgi:hypothetical protein